MRSVLNIDTIFSKHPLHIFAIPALLDVIVGLNDVLVIELRIDVCDDAKCGSRASHIHGNWLLRWVRVVVNFTSVEKKFLLTRCLRPAAFLRLDPEWFQLRAQDSEDSEHRAPCSVISSMMRLVTSPVMFRSHAASRLDGKASIPSSRRMEGAGMKEAP